MFLTRYIVFLLFILICELINNTNQNDLSFLKNNYQQRIKRFLFHKSSKLKQNNQKQFENDQTEDILLNNGQYHHINLVKQSKKEPNKGYTQQDLAEIKRILSKKEYDYYGILNIDKQATPAKIKDAYRKLSLRVHPDKISAPGATEATQKLNKARDELLKKVENQNQNNNQPTTVTYTTRLFTFNEHKKYQTTVVINKFNSFETSSSLPSTPNKKPSKTNKIFNNFTYLLFAFIILIIGIIIFIIFYKKRERYSLSNKKHFKKQNIYPTYDTPQSDDASVIIMNEDSEASNTQDEE